MNPVVVCESPMLGGAERYLTRLYSRLSAHGDQPVLLGHVPGWQDAGLSSVDVAFGPKWSGRRVYTGRLRLPWERRLVRKALVELPNAADVFHVQFKREQIGLTPMLRRFGPVVWTEHGRLVGNPDLERWRDAYASAAESASAIICVSDAVAADVADLLGHGRHVHVIENAVDTAAFAPPTAVERAEARRTLGLELDQPVYLWLGRLVESKRPSLACATGAQTDGTLILAGDGPERDSTARSAEHSSQIVMLGHRDDVRTLYHAADALLFTSSGAGEGLPFTIVEASACGLPVVLNEGSGLAAAVPGAIVAQDSSQSLAQALMLARQAPQPAATREWANKRGLDAWAAEHRRILGAVAG